MMIVTVMLVAVFALLFGFLVGLCYQGKPAVKRIKTIPSNITSTSAFA